MPGGPNTMHGLYTGTKDLWKGGPRCCCCCCCTVWWPQHATPYGLPWPPCTQTRRGLNSSRNPRKRLAELRDPNRIGQCTIFDARPEDYPFLLRWTRRKFVTRPPKVFPKNQEQCMRMHRVLGTTGCPFSQRYWRSKKNRKEQKRKQRFSEFLKKNVCKVRKISE